MALLAFRICLHIFRTLGGMDRSVLSPVSSREKTFYFNTRQGWRAADWHWAKDHTRSSVPSKLEKSEFSGNETIGIRYSILVTVTNGECERTDDFHQLAGRAAKAWAWAWPWQEINDELEYGPRWKQIDDLRLDSYTWWEYRRDIQWARAQFPHLHGTLEQQKK